MEPEEIVEYTSFRKFFHFDDTVAKHFEDIVETDLIITNDKKFITPDIEVKSSSEYSSSI
jgi:hypothetical protein